MRGAVDREPRDFTPVFHPRLLSVSRRWDLEEACVDLISYHLCSPTVAENAFVPSRWIGGCSRIPQTGQGPYRFLAEATRRLKMYIQDSSPPESRLCPSEWHRASSLSRGQGATTFFQTRTDTRVFPRRQLTSFRNPQRIRLWENHEAIMENVFQGRGSTAGRKSTEVRYHPNASFQEDETVE